LTTPPSDAGLAADLPTATVDWAQLRKRVDAAGWSRTGPVLSAADCATLRESYVEDQRFRARIIMERHRFGRGEYKYFAYPLPPLVARLREWAYAGLAPLANEWMHRMRSDIRYPATLAEFLDDCAAAGQTRPTPLLLRYAAGDYNRLHQDLYGERYFPLQLVVLLDAPGIDFEGGALVLTEQRPRVQSRVQVVPLARGEGAVIAVNVRPVAGPRGTYRVTMRHGVSEITRGRRHTLGVVLHDSR
jgi:hypothetical protein